MRRIKITSEQIKKLKIFFIENDIKYNEADKYSLFGTDFFQKVPRVYVNNNKIIRISCVISYTNQEEQIKEFNDFCKKLFEYIGVKK